MNLDAIMRDWRLMFIRYCHRCTCHELGFCFRHLRDTVAWETCADWRETLDAE